MNGKAENTYSFRAELPQDVELFLNTIKCASPNDDSGMIIYATNQFPERHVELKTHLDLETLRNLLRYIPDSHLMLQTLRPGGMKDGGELERYYRG